jgi:hypothetical protein
MLINALIDINFSPFCQDFVIPILIEMLLNGGWTTSKNIEAEVIEVILTWQNTNIGGIFKFESNEKLSINLNLNRKVIVENYGVTDFNWYLMHILPIFHENDIEISSFLCKETFDDEYQV